MPEYIPCFPFAYFIEGAYLKDCSFLTIKGKVVISVDHIWSHSLPYSDKFMHLLKIQSHVHDIKLQLLNRLFLTFQFDRQP